MPRRSSAEQLLSAAALVSALLLVASRAGPAPLPVACWPRDGLAIALPAVVILLLSGYLVVGHGRPRRRRPRALASVAIGCASIALGAPLTVRGPAPIASVLLQATTDQALLISVASLWFVARPQHLIAAPSPRRRDSSLAIVFCTLVVAQSVLGAAQRVDPSLRLFHVLLGATAVMPLALRIGLFGLLVDTSPRRKAAVLVAASTLAQLVVGVLALLVPESLSLGNWTRMLDTGLVVLHRWLALLILTIAVGYVCRCLAADDETPGATDPA